MISVRTARPGTAVLQFFSALLVSGQLRADSDLAPGSRPGEARVRSDVLCEPCAVGTEPVASPAGVFMDPAGWGRSHRRMNDADRWSPAREPQVGHRFDPVRVCANPLSSSAGQIGQAPRYQHITHTPRRRKSIARRLPVAASLRRREKPTSGLFPTSLRIERVGHIPDVPHKVFRDRASQLQGEQDDLALLPVADQLSDLTVNRRREHIGVHEYTKMLICIWRDCRTEDSLSDTLSKEREVILRQRRLLGFGCGLRWFRQPVVVEAMT